eukprot:906048-Lingulodinium_polyedra.AAC.1
MCPPYAIYTPVVAPVALDSDKVDDAAGARAPVGVLLNVEKRKVPVRHETVQQCSHLGFGSRSR